MAQTLLNFAQDFLAQGAVKVLEKSKPVLSEIPVLNIQGNAYSYNILNTLPDVNMRTYDENIDSVQVLPDKKTVDLKIMSASTKVDRAHELVAGNINSVKAIELEASMENMGQTLMEQFFYGDGTGNNMTGLVEYVKAGIGKAFDGEITGDPATVDAEMTMIDEALNFVKDCRTETSFIAVSPATAIKLNRLFRNANIALTSKEAFSRSLKAYDGVAILTDEAVKDGELWIVRVGENYTSLVTNAGFKVYDRGLVGVHYITDCEGLFNVVVKQPRAVAVIRKSATKSK